MFLFIVILIGALSAVSLRCGEPGDGPLGFVYSISNWNNERKIFGHISSRLVNQLDYEMLA